MSRILAPEWSCEVFDVPAGDDREEAVLLTIRSVFDAAQIDWHDHLQLPVPAYLYEEQT